MPQVEPRRASGTWRRLEAEDETANSPVLGRRDWQRWGLHGSFSVPASKASGRRRKGPSVQRHAQLTIPDHRTARASAPHRPAPAPATVDVTAAEDSAATVARFYGLAIMGRVTRKVIRSCQASVTLNHAL